jgi:hypothetical protein
MKRSLISAAVASALMAAAMSPDANAQSSSDLEALKAQLQALQNKVQALEKQQATQQEAQDRTTDALAQSRAATSGSGDWLSRFQFKGDFRYRFENIDPEEAVTDQSRQRIRARFGFSAKINDQVAAVVQLATNGGTNDPRSTNQTLGSGFDRKGVAIDLAYVDWKAFTGANVQLGKIPQPVFKVGTFFYDNDITPEGAAIKYVNGPIFASAYGFQLGELATASDPTVVGGQIGVKQPMGAVTFTGAVGYYDVGAVQNKVTAQPTGCTSAANPAFFGGAQGNTTVLVAGCPRLLNDYNIIDVVAQADFKAGGFPLAVFGEYLQNTEAENFDTGYSVGATLGKASDPQTWEVGLIYQKAEKDSQFAQFYDSDFAGGVTDTDGNVFRFGYAPLKNWVFNGTYFMNKRFNDVGTERDYDRYQLDFVYKF